MAYDGDEYDVVEYRLDGGDSQSQPPAAAAPAATLAPAHSAAPAPALVTPADVILRHLRQQQQQPPRGGGGGGGGDDALVLLADRGVPQQLPPPPLQLPTGPPRAAATDAAAAPDLLLAAVARQPVRSPRPAAAAVPPDDDAEPAPSPPKRQRRAPADDVDKGDGRVGPVPPPPPQPPPPAAAAAGVRVSAARSPVVSHPRRVAPPPPPPPPQQQRATVAAPTVARHTSNSSSSASALRQPVRSLPPAPRRAAPAQQAGALDDDDDDDADVAALEAATPARPRLRPRSSASSRGPLVVPAASSSLLSGGAAARSSGGGGGGGDRQPYHPAPGAARGGASRFMRPIVLVAHRPSESGLAAGAGDQHPARRPTLQLAPGIEVSQSLLKPEPASPGAARRDADYTSQVQSSSGPPWGSPAAVAAAAAAATAMAAPGASHDGAADDSRLAHHQADHETTMLPISDVAPAPDTRGVAASRRGGAPGVLLSGINPLRELESSAAASQVARAHTAAFARYGSSALRAEDTSNDASLLWRLTRVRSKRAQDETRVALAESELLKGDGASRQIVNADPRTSATALSILIAQQHAAGDAPVSGRARLLCGSVESSSEPGFEHGAAVRLLLPARAAVSAGQTVTLWSPFWASACGLVLGQRATKLVVAGHLFTVT